MRQTLLAIRLTHPSRFQSNPRHMLRLESSMNTTTTDSGRIRLGGGFRLPVTSKITLGGGFRLPATGPVSGKITLGGGFRLPVAR